MTARHMLWGVKCTECYDLILCSDCIFFEKFHKDLIISILSLMAKGSICLLSAQKRGETVENFMTCLRILANEMCSITIESIDEMRLIIINKL